MTEIETIQLQSLINIMDRELYEFEASHDPETLPQRIDDFRALVSSMKRLISQS